MALAVASTSTVATPNADNLTITKPTGVASGDLLVLCIGADNTNSIGSGDYPSCSGFTTGLQVYGGVGNGYINPRSGQTFLWRIADSTDVSASNYTITHGLGLETLGLAVMMRITGWTTGNPIFTSSTVNLQGATVISQSGTFTRPFPQLLIMAGSSQYSTVRTSATYQITSADANPTWTEVQDTNVQMNNSGSSKNQGHSVAYANSSNTSNITSWGFTYSGSTTATAALLVIICEPQNVTADVAQHAILPEQFGVTASSVNVVSSVSHQNIPVGQSGITGKASGDDTQWINETANPTTWVNETL